MLSIQALKHPEALMHPIVVVVVVVVAGAAGVVLRILDTLSEQSQDVASGAQHFP